MLSDQTAKEVAAELNAVATVRVLNDDKTWRHRRVDEESEEGMAVKDKQLLTLAFQVCAQSPTPSASKLNLLLAHADRSQEGRAVEHEETPVRKLDLQT